MVGNGTKWVSWFGVKGVLNPSPNPFPLGQREGVSVVLGWGKDVKIVGQTEL